MSPNISGRLLPPIPVKMAEQLNYSLDELISKSRPTQRGRVGNGGQRGRTAGNREVLIVSTKLVHIIVGTASRGGARRTPLIRNARSAPYERAQRLVRHNHVFPSCKSSCYVQPEPPRADPEDVWQHDMFEATQREPATRSSFLILFVECIKECMSRATSPSNE